jgi:short-subunit dehydrogenase
VSNYLIFGASRGLGAFFSQVLPTAGDTLWLVSRSQPDLFDSDGVKRIWIEVDLSQSGVSAHIAAAIKDISLDVCIYNAGIWEELAFSKQYDYEQVSDEEIERIVTVNLLSAITCIQKALPALRRSSNAKIIFIGSNAGLENSKRPETAYTATKFGLRGFTHALREVVRKDSIGVTCLNLGDIGWIKLEAGKFVADVGSSGRALISLEDIIIMLKAIISLSNSACVKEIDMLAMTDEI